MTKKRVFVTVGTTKFPKLIEKITSLEVIETLINMNCEFVQLQTGNDFSGVRLSPDLKLSHTCTVENNTTVLEIDNKITLKYDPYFEDFEKQIEDADLVISHAGAGSCLEVLHKRKPLIVVINDDLMDNHQIELAEELERNGFLYYSKCDNLHEALKKDFSALKPYPQPEKSVFGNYLDRCMGFS